MMWTYNRTYEALKLERGDPGDDKKMRERLVWAAYNETLVENSKTFHTMMALNRSNSEDEQALKERIEKILVFFGEKKLNMTKVYYDFVDQFYANFEKKTIKSEYSRAYKIYRKLRSDFLRFKQRFGNKSILDLNDLLLMDFFLNKLSFTMVYLAIKSILTKEDFVKLVNVEIYNETTTE